MRPVSTASYTKRHLHPIALLTVAGAIGAASPADAALYYWPGQSYAPGYYDQDAPVQPRRPRPKRLAPKTEAVKNTAAKPQGPLIIAVSIQNQTMRVYDANGLFAESPISSGMQGHSTPMGVFSIIQKQKYHVSNIYSGAPMPYMQRITWSGIAMHAGALPGYPASHGCIRLPMAFATKIYGWTRMGARVIVTPGEMKPASFAHALLPTQKVAPQPMASDDSQKDTPLGVKSDKGADAAPAAKLEADIALELRTTIGHAQAPETTNMQTRTADAGSAAPTMSDAVPPVATSAKPDDTAKPDAAKTTADAPQPDSSDAKKDPARLPAANADQPKRTGQIAVFISRKDSKLYVRQNFAPLFEVPVTIAPGDRPLGTHVFTAETDKADANTLRWSVISMPANPRTASRITEDDRSLKPRRIANVTAETRLLPDSPSETLDRITIPQDAMARLAEALTTGGSIIVSDQGVNSGETGEGTDFIVPLR